MIKKSIEKQSLSSFSDETAVDTAETSLTIWLVGTCPAACHTSGWPDRHRGVGRLRLNHNKVNRNVIYMSEFKSDETKVSTSIFQSVFIQCTWTPIVHYYGIVTITCGLNSSTLAQRQLLKFHRNLSKADDFKNIFIFWYLQQLKLRQVRESAVSSCLRLCRCMRSGHLSEGR